MTNEIKPIKMQPQRRRRKTNFSKNLILKYTLLAQVTLLVVVVCLRCANGADSPTPASQPISSRAAFLRAQRASRQQQQPQPQPSTNNTQNSSSPPKPKPKPKEDLPQQPVVNPQGALQQAAQQITTPSNRSTRTADIFQNGDGFKISVTPTCERERMQVNIKTGRPFYGKIHSRDQRNKSICTIGGTGETDYNLNISQVLNQQDPNYCGVVKARKESPDVKDLLSVVIVVRLHSDIELSDDKFYLLNCTNRCRRPDCSSPTSARLTSLNDGGSSGNARVIADEIGPEVERESVTPSSAAKPGSGSDAEKNKQPDDECNIYKLPWVITLLWCMGILLLAMIISHCIMCSSMVCRCVKTEVEEREPSVYEDGGDTDDEDNLYNKKNHPMRIDYDNRNIYKTSNNYEPYSLDNDSCAEPKKSSRYSSSKPRRSSRR